MSGAEIAGWIVLAFFSGLVMGGWGAVYAIERLTAVYEERDGGR
jgi:hypothetical protein